MTAPAWLIAGREFRAYVATASFWIALAVGPVLMAASFALGAAAAGPPAPVAIAVSAPDPALARSAAAALAEAGALEGRRLIAVAPGASPIRLDIAPRGPGRLEARFAGAAPLSPAARAFVARTIERDLLARAAPIGAAAPPARVAWRAAPSPAAADTGALARFSLVMILWLTLTGSLGMLLQAVVRERASRALEGLLAAARPGEIVLGKLVGIGAVSLLVLAAWLGSAAGLAAVGGGGGGAAGAVIAGLAAPAMLARAAVIYLLAFAFYGLSTVAIGAGAADGAAAQNLSRPMFAVLLAAFFAALAAVAAPAGRLDFLIYLPPFSPFMLLLAAPGRIAPGPELAAVGLMLIATLAAGRLALARLTLTGAVERRRGR